MDEWKRKEQKAKGRYFSFLLLPFPFFPYSWLRQQNYEAIS
jgi:hypothetical protein